MIFDVEAIRIVDEILWFNASKRLDGPDPASMRPQWLFVRTSSNDLTTRRVSDIW